ncbi:MAG: methylenetetrahydrofolate reductase [NAD(P)H] [Deltaproteobacteria bacterium]|nr:methylenetetrahydrofolate reductase [NAD(P)H] [Deltaproteobacteria bacterium]
MKVRARLNPSRPCFSFEFFPPKTDEGEARLMETLHELQGLEPGFVSVTYGAGGGERSRSLSLATRIQRETGLTTVAHVACVGHTRAELGEILDRLSGEGIQNVLALRGDVPRDGGQPPGDFRHAQGLVEFIQERGQGLCVGGAGYPEGHVETLSREQDLLHLKAKVDAGLDYVVTQLFFDNAFYFDFVERARRVGINVPIVPGIMPITSYVQVKRFIRMCGATVPMRLQLQLERLQEDPQSVTQLGVAHATVQCMELLQRGAPGIHFYTLNKSPAARLIVGALHGRV